MTSSTFYIKTKKLSKAPCPRLPASRGARRGQPVGADAGQGGSGRRLERAMERGNAGEFGDQTSASTSPSAFAEGATAGRSGCGDGGRGFAHRFRSIGKKRPRRPRTGRIAPRATGPHPGREPQDAPGLDHEPTPHPGGPAVALTPGQGHPIHGDTMDLPHAGTPVGRRETFTEKVAQGHAPRIRGRCVRNGRMGRSGVGTEDGFGAEAELGVIEGENVWIWLRAAVQQVCCQDI